MLYRTKTPLAIIATTIAISALSGVSPALASQSDYRENTLAALEAALNSVDQENGENATNLKTLAGPEATRNTFDLNAHLACIPVDELFYCPLRGWDNNPNTPLLENNSISSTEPKGDKPFTDLVAEIKSLPIETQRKIISDDLKSAISSVGKVLADEAMLNDRPIKREILQNFPEAQLYSSKTTEPFDASSTPRFTPFSPLESPQSSATLLSAYFSTSLVWQTPASKQERSYWCGPASLAFMSWHDPKVSNSISHSQSQWANWLGTTTSGTSIWSIADQINKRLTGWRDRVDGYVVKSVAGWSVSNWKNRFLTTIGAKKAPIQLHPRFTGRNSTYLPKGYSAAGHFNVGVGYELNTDGTMRALVFEPWNPGGMLPTKLLWEHIDNIKEQHDAHPMHNIAF